MTDQQIQELRNAFLQKLEKDGAADVGKYFSIYYFSFTIYWLIEHYFFLRWIS